MPRSMFDVITVLVFGVSTSSGPSTPPVSASNFLSVAVLRCGVEDDDVRCVAVLSVTSVWALLCATTVCAALLADIAMSCQYAPDLLCPYGAFMPSLAALLSNSPAFASLLLNEYVEDASSVLIMTA